jgi:hypothetical protein
MSPLNLATVLFGKTQRALLAIFFARPDESFYLRQIVRMAGGGQGAIQRELKRWVEAGLLTKTRKGNQLHYQANKAMPTFPVERRIFEHQAEYYQFLQESTGQTDSAPFIAFMLRMIMDTVTTSAPQVAPQVTPQVGDLMSAIQGEMSREALQSALGLLDRKSFRERYLKPALADGLIEMTIPAKPSSRLQKYRLTDQGRLWLKQHGNE